MNLKNNEMTAFCGLICHECDAYLVTKSNDNAKRVEIAKKWSQMFEHHRDLKPEDLVCDGCLAVNGRLFKTCRTCSIRACGLERGVANCGYCIEYPCGKTDWIFKIAPETKQRLDELRKSFD